MAEDDAPDAYFRKVEKAVADMPRWTPAEQCREMVAYARPEGAPIALTVYPRASHAFDVAQFQPAVNLLGHLCEFNEAAARDAEQKLHAFLASHLGPTPLGKSGTE